MTSAPKLLHTDGICLPSELLLDLQLDKLLSKQTLAVLRGVCDAREIARRNELFSLLDRPALTEKLEHALSVLRAHEKALELLRDADIPLERCYRQADVLHTYLASVELLQSMRGLGSMFADVADYFSAEDTLLRHASMKSSLQKVRSLLGQIRIGVLSFADRIRLTPEDTHSEFDRISKCAHALGFDTPRKKSHGTKPNRALSDAICRLFASETAQIEAELAKYQGIRFDEPNAYIPELRFCIEILRLVQKADALGIPHCIATIATHPQYRASALYDISLLAKNRTQIVPNDASFDADEPFCFLLGANGGGKTTYLRALGINLLFFLAGCPVFAKRAEIYPFDTVLSHFPKDERFDNTGRLDEERKRIAQMLADTRDKKAFLLLNETYSGTDEARGFALLTETASQIGDAHHFGLYVTHFHKVMALDVPVLSAEVDTSDENKRTYRIVRSKGSASSYALDILKKYRLDKESLTARRKMHGNQSAASDAE